MRTMNEERKTGDKLEKGNMEDRKTVERIMSKEDALAMGRAAAGREYVFLRSIGSQTTRKGPQEPENWKGRRWKTGEEILERYVVEGELGQGGMGVVYACFDKVGGVKVAIKTLPSEVSHSSVEMEEVRENFRLVGGLRHENVVGVKTLERDVRGEYFLVMDVAEGENLRYWMRRRGLETGGRRHGAKLDEALPILRQVAAALDYAHRERVVHRDVKPENIVIDGRGRVKVMDFGLAAQIRTSLDRANQACRGTSGTGPYMAPEQWEAQPQDEKTDQYALAVTAYEMLAGRLPFESSDPDVLKIAVLGGKIPEVPGLDRRAMVALRRAMDKVPGNRFSSCRDFVDALASRRALGTGGKHLALRCCTALAVLVLAVWAVWRFVVVPKEDGTEVENALVADIGLPETSSAESAPTPLAADSLPESVEEVLERARDSRAEALAIQDKNRAAIAAVEEFTHSDTRPAP